MLRIAIVAECDICHKKEFFEREKGRDITRPYYGQYIKGISYPESFRPSKTMVWDLFLNQDKHFCSEKCYLKYRAKESDH